MYTHISAPLTTFVLDETGLDGIEKGGYKLVGPINEDLFEWSRDELKERRYSLSFQNFHLEMHLEGTWRSRNPMGTFP